MQEFLKGGALSIDRLIEERARRLRREHADRGESTPIEKQPSRRVFLNLILSLYVNVIIYLYSLLYFGILKMK